MASVWLNKMIYKDKKNTSEQREQKLSTQQEKANPAPTQRQEAGTAKSIETGARSLVGANSTTRVPKTSNVRKTVSEQQPSARQPLSLQQSMEKTRAQSYVGKSMAQLLAEKMQAAMQQSSESRPRQTRQSTAYQRAAEGKNPAPGIPSVVARYGSGEDYTLVERAAAARVDFSDWGSKNTTQQREALKRSGLAKEEQWSLLNKDGNYLETLYDISKIQTDPAAYGLSRQEAEEKSAELLGLAAIRANATGNDRPYLGSIPRGEMVRHIDEKRDELLRSINYPEADGVGGGGRLWYDEENNILSYPQPTPYPKPTPTPQTTPNPEITPLPQPGPSPAEELNPVDWGKELRKSLQKAWQTIAKLQPRRAVVAAQNAIRESAEDNPQLKRLLETVDAVVPQSEQLAGIKLGALNTFTPIDFVSIMNGIDYYTTLGGQEAWEKYVQKERKLVDNEDPLQQTWDESMITNQGAYPAVWGSMGPFGSLQDNGCGPMGLHNVNRILGEDSEFADVAYEVTADSSNRTILGGLLGMNPLTVRDYYERKGYRVTPYIGTEFVEKGHDAYLAMYLYGSDQGIGKFIPTGGHYVAAEYDSENDQYITYNDEYGEYPIPMKNLSYLDKVGYDTKEDKFYTKNRERKKFVYVWGIDKRG